MQRIVILAATFAAGLGCAIATQAQTAPASTAVHRQPAGAAQRNVNQQQRIENGLESGTLTTREASRLERGQQAIDKTEQRALANGKLSAAERSRIRREQNVESRAIHAQTHDAQNGNPDSRSARRMQADVQRNVNQQQRIRNGVANGSLTNREAGHMEGRQAHSDRELAAAGRNGRIGWHEQARVRHTDNRNSRRLYLQKHDRQYRRH